MKSFFRWMPTTIILWFFGLIFLLFGVFEFKFAVLSENGELPRTYLDSGLTRAKITRSHWKGFVQDCSMGALCVSSWYFMRRRTRTWMICASLATLAALAITFRSWLYWELHRRNATPLFEPVFVWPFLCYAATYGFLESRTMRETTFPAQPATVPTQTGW
jgi:hypothetical protein